MISETQVKKYCNEGPSLIENYLDAMNDETQLWHCHHRLEIQPNGVKVSRYELISSGMYYHRPANELIFLTETEHRRIHHVGKVLSEDTKRKLSEANKGRQSPNKGKTSSEETRRKISEARKAYWEKRKNNEASNILEE